MKGRPLTLLTCVLLSLRCTAPAKVNLVPIADAGADQVVGLGDRVTLNAGDSRDPDGDDDTTLTFEWVPVALPRGSEVKLIGKSSATANFIVDEPGTYLFAVFVTDVDGGRSEPDVVTVSAAHFLQVDSTFPASGATGLPTTTPIVVRFNAPVQTDSINSHTVFLTQEREAIIIARTLSEGNRAAVFRPLSPLPANTTVVLSLNQGIRNLLGETLSHPYALHFTTASGSDKTPPQVLNVVPAAATTDAARSASVVVDFSEAVNPARVTSTSFTLSPDGGPAIAAVVVLSAGDTRATLTPNAPLMAGESYTIDLTAAITDRAGLAMAPPWQSSFTVTAIADTTGPRVMAIDPNRGFSNISTRASILITFSEPVDPASVSASSLAVTDSAGMVVTGTRRLSVGNRVLTFFPDDLRYNTTYIVTLTSDVADAAGNALVETPFASDFSTTTESLDIDHFEVTAGPTALTVGEKATVVVTAKKLDGTTNRLYQNDAPATIRHLGSQVNQLWSGRGVTDRGDGTAAIAGGSFVDGVARLELVNYIPDADVEVLVSEADTGRSRSGTTQTTSTNISWAVGPLTALAVTVDNTALTAGQQLKVTITAQDQFQNPIVGYGGTGELLLSQDGDPRKTWIHPDPACLGESTSDTLGNNRLLNNPACWQDGVVQLALLNNVAESLSVRVRETDGSPDNSSDEVTWSPGPLDRFRVEAESTASDPIAGSPVQLTITARDLQGNPINNYINSVAIDLFQNLPSGAPVTWGGCATDTGDGGATLAGNCWTSGMAEVSLTSNLAVGPVTASLQENDTGLRRSGSTAFSNTDITWVHGPLDHFRVTGPLIALPLTSDAGVTLTAEDQFDNPIPGYLSTAGISVTPKPTPGSGEDLTFRPLGINLGDDTALIPRSTPFDTLGRYAMGVETNFATGVDLNASLGSTTIGGSTTTQIVWVGSGGCPPTDPVASLLTGTGPPDNSCQATLDSSGSSAGNAGSITRTWTLVSIPPGSTTTLSDTAAARPTLALDHFGDYVIQLTVANDCGSTRDRLLLVVYNATDTTPAVGEVVITEVVTDPQQNWSDSSGAAGAPYDATPAAGTPVRTLDQWVEVYNASGCPVDLRDWNLLMINSPTREEIRALNDPRGHLTFSAGSSLEVLAANGYLIIGDPALDQTVGGSLLPNQTALQLWRGPVRTGMLISAIELDPLRGADPLDDGDGNGTPGGKSRTVADEAVYRKFNTGAYSITSPGDPSDWGTTRTTASPLGDNPP